MRARGTHRPRGATLAGRRHPQSTPHRPAPAILTRDEVPDVRRRLAAARDGAGDASVDGAPHVEEEAAHHIDDRRVGDLPRGGEGGAASPVSRPPRKRDPPSPPLPHCKRDPPLHHPTDQHTPLPFPSPPLPHLIVGDEGAAHERLPELGEGQLAHGRVGRDLQGCGGGSEGPRSRGTAPPSSSSSRP